MTLLNKIITTPKTDTKIKNLPETLDNLLLEVESFRKVFDLKKIYDIVGEKLLENNIHSLFSISDKRTERLIIKNYYTSDEINKIINDLMYKKIISNSISIKNLGKYKIIFDTKKTIFCSNRIHYFTKKFPQFKNNFNKFKLFNSIITPLMLRGEIIGALELFSPQLTKEDISIIEKFSSKLINIISNAILFQELEDRVQSRTADLIHTNAKLQTEMKERKKKENDLRQSRKNHYEQVIDTIQDGICVIDNNFKIISCNKTFSNKTNLDFNNIKGKKCKQILPKYENGTFHNHCVFTDCKHNKKCMIKEALTTGETQTFIEKSKKLPNSPKYHRVNIFPAKNKNGKIYQAVLTIRDITNITKANEKIKRLSEYNKRILDNVPVSIMTIDKNGIITSANKYIKHISKTKNFLEKNIFTMPFYKRSGLVKKYQALLRDGIPFAKANCQTTNINNEIKFLNIIAIPLKNSQGEVEGAISMALDNTNAIITKEKIETLNEELEKKVIQRTWQLNQANKELEKVLDLKSKFISDASHELRTPLTIVQGNIDLEVQKFKRENKEAPEVYSLICKEIKQMAKILSDLTMLTNADSKTEQIIYQDIKLFSSIQEVGKSLEVLAKQKRIKIKIPKKNIDVQIKGDETKIEKLIINIARNSIKYTPKNGWVKLWLDKGANEARLIIEDNGIGIPEQDLPYIFERFYRVDKARSRNEGGTGLGLSICKWIAEAHGGFITVTSKLDQGTKFIVHLPFDYKKSQTTSKLF